MSPTTPDQQGRAALLVIDVQQALFEKPTPIYHAEEFLDSVNTLIDRADRAGAPVFFVQHADKKALVKGSEGWQLHPSLHHTAAGCAIHKQHGNSFEDTPLDAELKSRGVNRVVVAGLVTHGCVRATCLGAKALGYEVVLASDGHSSYSRDAAQLIEEWNAKLGEDTAELKPASDILFG